jgi:hypothetical protein
MYVCKIVGVGYIKLKNRKSSYFETLFDYFDCKNYRAVLPFAHLKA